MVEGHSNQVGPVEPSIKYSYLDGARRIALTMQLNGTTVVELMTPEGEVRETHQDVIDPRDAHRLVTELFDVVPNLQSRPDGETWVRLEQDGQVWDYALSEFDIPHRGLDVGRVMRMIAGDIMAGYDVRSDRREGGPRRAKMTVFGFIKWSVYFVLGLVAAFILGQLGLIAAGLIGPFMFSVAYTLSGFFVTGAYWSIGRRFGEHYRGQFPVWPVAVASCAPLAAFLLYYASVFALIPVAGMFWLIVWAHAGEKAGY